ncbi:MAG: competence protein ComK [Candidatus Izimaplasma sp.]|nr:competence protein ComK [Candidatus Izimaplasma bacterium]
MIDYIIKNNFKLIIAEDNHIEINDIPITRYFNDLLKPCLTDLKSREKQTKRYFKFKSKIPIYIDKNHLFLAIYSYRLEKAVYINYFSICSWTKIDNKVIVKFLSGHCIKLKSYYNFINQNKKVERILLDYKIKIN